MESEQWSAFRTEQRRLAGVELHRKIEIAFFKLTDRPRIDRDKIHNEVAGMFRSLGAYWE